MTEQPAQTPAPGRAEPTTSGVPSPSTMTMPKGGGAIKGIGEKFGTNPATGTAQMTVPIAATRGRSGFGPQLSLSYDSGTGNGPFGLGWSIDLPAITRRTDRGVPRYDDADESDTFLLSGAEDLVPVLTEQAGRYQPGDPTPRTVAGTDYQVWQYRPRTEGLFARIERWTNPTDASEIFWRTISRDNITTWYGRTPESRVADPADDRRIFSWLICETHDDRGNLALYHYKAENDEAIETSRPSEHNRDRRANRYLERIRYGNHLPHFPTLDPDSPWPAPPQLGQWLFELVFDYGEHDLAEPGPADRPGWQPRPDPFSSYRSGFEVRTHRLCRRVLMFHHFPGHPEIGADCLVRSTDLTYTYEHEPHDPSRPIHATLAAVTQRGYQRRAGGYRSRALPPVQFSYSEAVIEPEVHTLDDRSAENLPIGFDGIDYQWADLDGEGLPGLLTAQNGSWYYKPNISPATIDGNDASRARLDSLRPIDPLPAMASARGAQLLDLDGDGRLDLARFTGPAPGFHDRTDTETWLEYRTFRDLPRRDLDDSDLRFVDLDGDGIPDILITQGDTMAWHRSLGKDGFGPEQRVAIGSDENHGPALIFADPEHSIHLADMTGDGLNDLVRISDSEVCYWPNLGHCRFGKKVTMEGPPAVDGSPTTVWLERTGLFDQRRVRLADIDGSGTTDIIYLHTDGIRIYFNQSGNRWCEPVTLPTFPATHTATNIATVDLLGNGTACLVWSSMLAADARSPLRYIDLMGGTKPHLMLSMTNNLGATTELHYASSTKFYLRDKQAGTPWITRLPFPVHVVEQVTVRDQWRGTCFSSTYSYHHGYFDPIEREFRGFARVEQVDVEDYGTFSAENVDSPYVTHDHRLYQPPVKTITWFHTGAAFGADTTLHPLEHEYFPHSYRADHPGALDQAYREHRLPPVDLATARLSEDERREAARVCKGLALRQEVYQLDLAAVRQGRHRPVRLFSATSRNGHVELIQPRATNRHAVFHVTESETLNYTYELDLTTPVLAPDPRITHALNLTVDEYGNIRQSVTVAYPRRSPVAPGDLPAENGVAALIAALQTQLRISYLEFGFTTDATALDEHRPRLACELRTYEIAGVTTAEAGDGTYFSLDKLRRITLSERYPGPEPPLPAIDSHRLGDPAGRHRRLVEHTRSLFYDNDADSPLALGQLHSRALPYQTYTLTLTDPLLHTVFGEKLGADVTAALATTTISGYLTGAAAAQRLGADTAGQYWRCGGSTAYGPDPAEHFFMPRAHHDPFGNPTTLEYDNHHLTLRRSTDALGNDHRTITFDYRVMLASSVEDANGNRSHVRFDVLGMPAAAALSGKAGEGEQLDGIDDDLINPDTETLRRFFVIDTYDPTDAQHQLGAATARYLYYFGETVEGDTVRWGRHPAAAATIVREQHASDHPNSPVQTSFDYLDGSGNILVKKIQAEPETPAGPLRWVAAGKTVLNNKAKPVKQYEPYFSAPDVGHRFEEPAELGVTPLMFYDAAGRAIAVQAPDGSITRIEFSPWRSTCYDANDTALEPGNPWFSRASGSADTAVRRCAEQTAAHAGTPTVTVLDTLGRPVVTITHNRIDAIDHRLTTFRQLDAKGNPLWVQDARGIRVMQAVMPPRTAGPHPFDEPANLRTPDISPAYDLTGQLLVNHGGDNGTHWTLPTATGQPLFVWNSRGHRTRIRYDALQRPLAVFARASGDSKLDGSPRNPADPPSAETLVERRVYGEAHTDTTANLRGRLYRVYDSAGVETSARYDFKGQLLSADRRFTRDYTTTPDWSALSTLTAIDGIAAAAEPLLDAAAPLVTTTEHDALNRPTAITTPDASRHLATYNKANLLQRLTVTLHGTDDIEFITGIDYNAKGQPTRIGYGNGSTTRCDYDPLTFRPTTVRTVRPAAPDSTASLLFTNPTVVQDLRYTHDPVGNITRIVDAARTTTANAGSTCQYVYDPLYRLITAAGREHSGQTQSTIGDSNRRDYPFDGHRIHPNDLLGLRDYIERYRYDAVGNIMALSHHLGHTIDQPGATVWKRHYQYALDSNQLRSTSLPADADAQTEYTAVGDYSLTYTHDPHGNVTSTAHLPLMRWDHKDQLAATSQQQVNDGTGGITYYSYDAAGQRVRKVTKTQGGQIKNERRYVGAYELYREYGQGAVTLSRETLHVRGGDGDVAIVETATAPAEPHRIRYQLANTLGSTVLELDELGALITYEEYHPYGTTAFQTGRSSSEVSLKRYRYTGKERDTETGFTYHGARYYAPWLGRWTSCDPAGLVDGTNLYTYASDSPVNISDPTGLQGITSNEGKYCRPVTYKNLEEYARSNAGPEKEDHDDGSITACVWEKLPSASIARQTPAPKPARTKPRPKSAPKSEAAPAAPVPDEPPPEPDHRFGWYPIKEAQERREATATAEIKEGHYLSALVDHELANLLKTASVIEDLMPYNAPDHFLSAGMYAKRWIWYDRRGQSMRGLYELFQGHMQAGSVVGGFEIAAQGVKLGAGVNWGMLLRDSRGSMGLPGSMMPEVVFDYATHPELADNIWQAQAAGHPKELTYMGNRALAAVNRGEATNGIPHILSRDEYPFASTSEGGAGAWMGHIPGRLNSAQGGILSGFYRRWSPFGSSFTFRVRVINHPRGPVP